MNTQPDGNSKFTVEAKNVAQQIANNCGLQTSYQIEVLEQRISSAILTRTAELTRKNEELEKTLAEVSIIRQGVDRQNELLQSRIALAIEQLTTSKESAAEDENWFVVMDLENIIKIFSDATTPNLVKQVEELKLQVITLKGFNEGHKKALKLVSDDHTALQQQLSIEQAKVEIARHGLQVIATHHPINDEPLATSHCNTAAETLKNMRDLPNTPANNLVEKENKS